MARDATPDHYTQPVSDETSPYSAALSEGVVAVTTSSATLVNANADRSEILLVNVSDTDLTFRLSTASVTAGEGLVLVANGGTFCFPYSGAITCRHGGSGSKNVYVAEF